MTTKTITVTQDDINRGHKFIAYSCPIALAAERAFPNFHVISSNFDAIIIKTDQNIRRWFALPKQATNFMRDFDCGKQVTPFKFRVREIKTK